MIAIINRDVKHWRRRWSAGLHRRLWLAAWALAIAWGVIEACSYAAEPQRLGESAQPIDPHMSKLPPASMPYAAVLSVPVKPLLPIVIEGVGTLQPPEDVTPAEAAWLAVLAVQITAWMRATMNPFRMYNPDWPAFVHEHHLERCFVKDKEMP
jgi:hypothetical protein